MAVVVHEVGVGAAARRHRRHALGREGLEPTTHVCALEPKQTHVRDIEQACAGPGGHVLLRDRAVPNGQLKAVKIHDAPAEGDVLVVEGRAHQRSVAHALNSGPRFFNL